MAVVADQQIVAGIVAVIVASVFLDGLTNTSGSIGAQHETEPHDSAGQRVEKWLEKHIFGRDKRREQ